MPDDPRRNTETPTTRANKSSAMRWALGIAVLFIVGVIAWWVSGLPRGENPVTAPAPQTEQNQSGYQSLEGKETPSAVVPNQDSGGSPPATPEPAGPGTQ